MDSGVKLPGQTDTAEAEEIDLSSGEVADFGLKFTVPKVCLNLRTRRKAISRKISNESNEWELQTDLENI